jgi:lysophospholipase L1-like esterase
LAQIERESKLVFLFHKIFFSIFFFGVFFFGIHSLVYATTPDQISGLKLWLDASSGVTKDGSTPAIDGDTVQQWNDLSVGGFNATQATAGNRPTYKTNIINGNPVLRFNGAHNMTTASFLDSSFNTSFTFFIVTSKTDTTLKVSTSNSGISWYSGGTSNSIVANYLHLGGQIVQAAIGTKLTTNPTIQAFRYNGSQSTIWFDGVSKSESRTGTLQLSGALTVGSLSSNSFYYNGDIAEIIIYNSALDDTQVGQIESYLEVKYGISDILPPTSIPLIIFEGDSMTSGVGSTSGLTYPNQTQTFLGFSATYQNLGIPSQSVVAMSTDASDQIDPEYSISRTTNIISLLGGTNDLFTGADATTTYNRIVSYLQGRRTAGFKVIVNTILPRSNSGTPVSFEENRQTVNTLIRSNWTTFADGISDISSDTRIGDVNDELDVTYYPDRVHLTNAGYGIVASYVTAAIKQIMDPIVVSSVVVTPSTTSATITWITNQLGSTKVNYGLSSSYGSSNTETDITTRILNHNTSLSGLISCATYHFQTVSTDLNGNQTVSGDNTFTTSGCTGSAAVDSQTASAITTASGGSLNLLSGGTGINVTIPASFSGSDANFQIKQLDKTSTINTTSVPTSYLTIGSYIYDLKSLSNVSTLISTFNNPLTITMTYGDSDIVGIDESSLKIYRWDDSSWNQLSGCLVNTSARTVTCQTSNFSVFGLFGTVATSGTTSGSTLYGCKDSKALNYNFFVTHNQSLCEYTNTTIIQPTYSLIKTLKLNSKNNDVKELQKFLNTHGYLVSATGAGSLNKETTYFGPKTKKAVIKFQTTNDLVPDGIVGPKTREKIINIETAQ